VSKLDAGKETNAQLASKFEAQKEASAELEKRSAHFPGV
jgi:hypothetical protein